jgi:hypothetical protein
LKADRSFREAFTPWAGLIVSLIAVAFVHQFGSGNSFDHCWAAAPLPILVVATLGLIACVIAGVVSWRSLRGEDEIAGRVIATVSVGCAAVFGLAIILPMIATVVLPPCFG